MLAVALAIAVIFFGDALATSKMSVLRSSVFHGYDKLVMPDSPMEVKFGITILNLHLCPHKQVQ